MNYVVRGTNRKRVYIQPSRVYSDSFSVSLDPTHADRGHAEAELIACSSDECELAGLGSDDQKLTRALLRNKLVLEQVSQGELNGNTADRSW